MQFLFTKNVSEKSVLAHITDKETDEVVHKGEREELLLGIGSREKMTRRKLLLLPRRMVMLAQSKNMREISIDWQEWHFPHLNIDEVELAEIFATNALMADFSFDVFKTKPKNGFSKVEKIFFDISVRKQVLAGLNKGIIIGEEVNASRHIATMPGGEMTPSILATHAKKAIKNLPIKLSVLDEKAMGKLKMGGILGVGKGSIEKSYFIVLEYWGAGKPAQGGSAFDGKGPVVLVGKGVTFDTGGINLKPSDSILGMNMDMSGGASVIHALASAARLKMKKNIVALIPAVENMASGSSYRPGDVLRSMSGKTIEVLNTDAEGRIILADALIYAKRYHPKLVVDVATLTGASLVALGERASALFTQDEKLEQLFRHLGEESGDHVWPLPLWDEYDDEVKGTFGDVANLGKTRWGGAITAAVFLKQFVDKAYPWVHLDIAPRMTTLSDEFLARGSAGAPVRLLVKLLEKF